MKNDVFLTTYIEERQKSSYYWFLAEDFLKKTGSSKEAFNQAVYRLAQKGKVVHVARRFYTIVPLEYQKQGTIPISWYIDPLMEFLNLPYYVSLLTAGSFLGVAHQQPQQFQVMVKEQCLLRNKNATSIYLVKKKELQGDDYGKQKCHTGFFNIAKSEVLLFDLVKYSYSSGYLSNIAMVFKELGGSVDPELLARKASSYPLAVIQRVGFLLDLLEYNQKTGMLYDEVKSSIKNYTLLTPGKGNDGRKEQKWKVIQNDEVELDL